MKRITEPPKKRDLLDIRHVWSRLFHASVKPARFPWCADRRFRSLPKKPAWDRSQRPGWSLESGDRNPKKSGIGRVASRLRNRERTVTGSSGLMATSRTNFTLRQIRTLFSLGRVGDRADGELLEWFESHHAEAEAAFEELVVRHGPMVLDVCRRVLRDPNDVADAFQATFLILVRRAGTIRNRDALGGWLHRVALRVALRAKSEAAHRHESEQQAAVPETADPTGDSIERADMRAALHEELDRIPATYRVAFVACYLEGLTHEEAANRLHWPVGTVRSRLARGGVWCNRRPPARPGRTPCSGRRRCSIHPARTSARRRRRPRRSVASPSCRPSSGGTGDRPVRPGRRRRRRPIPHRARRRGRLRIRGSPRSG
ncbi:RNA polymerase sigma factor [Singulisphaera sp. Ch08]|uniref:RNA polymerase sigma factor n=1 Tax=Singulisphaera sp. Ch08 TaxID=3120278 RepID=UPI003872F98A